MEWQIAKYDDAGALPYFTQLHLTGYLGIDFLEVANPEEIHEIGSALFREGTIAYQPTLIAKDQELVTRAIKTIEVARRERREDEAEILGIHLELPSSDLKAISHFLSAGTITMVTIDSDSSRPLELETFLTQMGVKVAKRRSDGRREVDSFVILELDSSDPNREEREISEALKKEGDRIIVAGGRGSSDSMRSLWERIARLVSPEAATEACATRPATLLGRGELASLEFGYPAQRWA